eukprot:TRINITY_DN50110_c0_g1_i1.p1 TRINITY_DN50110_c0_g1~~TRINITY_DN50110_c0_g1_i1.p1  ORF type:complete len:480 (+),score=160.51 TRINITY_DN50110_c0_g1_i1:70-1440(+)
MGPQQLAWAAAAAGAAVTAALCEGDQRVPLLACIGIAGCGCSLSLSAIASFGEIFVKAGRFGIDLNKHTTPRDSDGQLVRPLVSPPAPHKPPPKVPESMGLVVGAVFICCVSCFLPFAFEFEQAVADGAKGNPPPRRLTELVAALLSITCAVLLGFADDVLDVRWRHKVPLSFAPTLPLLLVYYAHIGVTSVVVPTALTPVLGDVIDLGPLFYAALACQAVFCTHTINILAGVNGLEVGQSVVIAVAIIILNIWQLLRTPADWDAFRGNQLFSLYIAVPFAAVSMALWYHNWWPSSVFVGDTFCYFAGMTFAACGILGHFSKTLWLFLIPQLINFFYSLPQLFRIIPIPRHRMPAFDPATGNVQLSVCEFKPGELGRAGRAVYSLLSGLRLVHVRRLPDGRVQMSNLTLICFFLYVFGPCREDRLCMRLLAFQVLCCALAFYVRFELAALFYDKVV